MAKMMISISVDKNSIWGKKQRYTIAFGNVNKAVHYGSNLMGTLLVGYFASKYPQVYYRMPWKWRGALEKMKND